MTRRAVGALLVVVIVGAAAWALGRTEAAFNSVPGSGGNSYAVAPDFVAPTVARTRVADPANGPSYAVRQCRFYQAYAEVTDTGNPASGVASVVANLSSLTAGVGADSLLGGTFTLDGVSYGYRGLPRLATASSGPHTYALTSTDDAGNGRVEGGLPATVTTNTAAVGAVFLTGLEQGVASSTAPGVFTTVIGSGVSADASVRRNGSYSLRTAPANAAAYAAVTLPGTGNTVVARFAVRLGSLPATTVSLAAVVPSGGSTGFLAYNSATGRFGVRWGAGSIVDGAVAPAAGTWHVIELRAVTANPRTLTWRVDGVDQTQVSSAETAANVTDIGLGTTAATVTYTANFDDVIASRTAADYPIGNGKVLSLAPNGVGTHVRADRFRNNDNSNIDINSWTRVDEVPATSTADYVKQTSANNASYIEFTFADTTEPCINAVAAVVAFHSSAAGTNVGKTSIFNGVTQNVVYSGSMGVTTLGYKRATVSAGTGAWTAAMVNSLVARVGYSSDISPIPYWDALLLEYDIPTNW